MVIGTDGNMWYCCNGLTMMDHHAKYTFERTLREAVEKYHKEYKSFDKVRADLLPYWNCTPEEYRADLTPNLEANRGGHDGE